MRIIKIKKYIERMFIEDDFFNKHCYIVGGYVRDVLLGYNPKDIDILVDKHYGSLKLGLMIWKKLKNEITKPMRLGNYPIWRLTFISGEFCGESIEIAETMDEEYVDSNSRQRLVKFASLKEDIYRRDFSINSLLMKFNCGDGLDSVVDISGNGINDLLNKKVIRCISDNVKEIFSVDPLRILRAIRFSIEYNYRIDEKTYNGMKKVIKRITILSKERIYSEIKKIGKNENGILKLVLILNEINGLQYVFPEIYKLKKIKQSPDIRMIHMEGSEYKCKNFLKNE